MNKLIIHPYRASHSNNFVIHPSYSLTYTSKSHQISIYAETPLTHLKVDRQKHQQALISRLNALITNKRSKRTQEQKPKTYIRGTEKKE